MIIKKFIEFNESLLPSQYREYVKDFDKNKYEKLFKSFTGEHDKNFYRIYLPIIRVKSETHSKIEKLLNKHGYEIIDYTLGRAKFKSAKNLCFPVKEFYCFKINFNSSVFCFYNTIS